jgi:hypothetical protein
MLPAAAAPEPAGVDRSVASAAGGERAVDLPLGVAVGNEWSVSVESRKGMRGEKE